MSAGIGSMMDELRVDPEVMTSRATNALNNAKKAKGHLEELKAIVSKSSAYWYGEGGDAYRRYFEEIGVEMEDVMRLVDTDIDKLYSIATVYRQTENENTTISAGLTEDVIF